MVTCVYPIKQSEYFWINLSMNNLLFLIGMVLICATECNSSELSSEIIDNCSNFKTCTTCMKNAYCNWYLDRQKCVNEVFKDQSTGTIPTLNEAACPKFSVVKNYSFGTVRYAYKIKITNNVMGFVEFLSRSNITCCLELCRYAGRVVGTDITCDTVTVSSRDPLTVYHFYVLINGVQLKFDNDVDYYYLAYNRPCAAHNKDEGCLTCLWNADEYRHYLKRCASENQCTGSIQVYKKRNVVNYLNVPVTPTNGSELVQCSNTSISSVEPASMTWLGGTELKIKVANHRILSDARTTTVTVAGRACGRLAPGDDGDTIVCIVAPPEHSVQGPARPDARGPVQITYSNADKSPPVTPSGLTLRSAQTVHLVYPEITGVVPLSVPRTGGTVMRIAVANHRNSTADPPVAVTVAGRDCVDPTTAGDGTLTCTVAPAESAGQAGTGTGTVVRDCGPVRMVYKSSSSEEASFAVASYETVELVVPEVASFYPPCGIADKLTELTVNGSFLDVGNVARVLVGDDREPCAVVARGRDHIRCHLASGVAGGRVTVEIDNAFSADAPGRFAVSASPFLFPGQRLVGIASGSTAISLHGRHFGHLTDVTVRAEHGLAAWHSACQVLNDTLMMCQTPRLYDLSLDSNATGPESPIAVDFRLEAELCDWRVQIGPPLDTLKFYMYPDPVYTGFSVQDDGGIALHGLGLDRGYRAEDLNIWYRDMATDCTVTLFTRDLVQCEFTAPNVTVDNAAVIVVDIGNRLVFYVSRIPTGDAGSYSTTEAVGAFSLLVSVVFASVFFLFRYCTAKLPDSTL